MASSTPRLPVPGQDDGVWGDVLNEFLVVEHNGDGTLKRAAEFAAKYDKPSGGIPKSDLSAAVQSELVDPSVYVLKAGDSMAGDLSFPATGFLMNDGTDTWRVTIDTTGTLVTQKVNGSNTLVIMGLRSAHFITQGFI